MSRLDDVLATNLSLFELETNLIAKLREPRYVRLLERGDEHTATTAMLLMIVRATRKELIPPPIHQPTNSKELGANNADT